MNYRTDDRVATNIQENRDPSVDPPGGSSGGRPVPGVYSGPRVVDERNAFTYNNVNPRINVTYYPSDNGMVYFNAATAFRAPIFVRGQQQVDLEIAGLSNLVSSDGTEVTVVELGAKWTLFNGELDLEGAIALADWQDVPVGISFEIDETGDGEPDRNGGVPISGSDADILTVEWQATWRATDNLTIRYLGSSTGGEFTADKSNVPGVFNYPPALQTGGELPNVADASHSLNIRYSAPLFDTGWQFFGNTNLSMRSKPKAVFGQQPDLVPAASAWKNVGLTLGARKRAQGLSFPLLKTDLTCKAL